MAVQLFSLLKSRLKNTTECMILYIYINLIPIKVEKKFEIVWQSHRAHLLNFIKTKVDDHETAEDILHEVGLKLLENLQQKTVIKNYQKWIFQVTRNTIADYYRKQEQAIDTPDEISQEMLSAGNCLCDLSGFVINNYLPKEYAEALFLSDIEQIPQKVIAERLGLSLSATKSRIQRGRDKLKKLITNCVEITFNNNGQVSDYHLKENCDLPAELLREMDKLKIML